MNHKKLRLTIIKLESGYIVAAERTNISLQPSVQMLDFEHAIAEGNQEGVHTSVKNALDYFLRVTKHREIEGSDGKD